MKIYLNIGLWFEDCCYVLYSKGSGNFNWNLLNNNARKCFLYEKFNIDIGRSGDLKKQNKIIIKYRKL